MKGIFCLEGFWYGDHRDKTSVFPVLDLVHRRSNMPFVHHRCATKEELIFSLKRWKTKSFHRKYPLLYLAFHGKKGHITIGKEEMSLEELAEVLENKCSGVVIYFGSCLTLKMDNRLLQNFMERTETVAIMGYKQVVDWLPSASFEIRLLDIMQEFPFDSKGIAKIEQSLKENCNGQIRELDFRFVTNERLWFVRSRKKQTR